MPPYTLVESKIANFAHYRRVNGQETESHRGSVYDRDQNRIKRSRQFFRHDQAIKELLRYREHRDQRP